MEYLDPIEWRDQYQEVLSQSLSPDNARTQLKTESDFDPSVKKKIENGINWAI